MYNYTTAKQSYIKCILIKLNEKTDSFAWVWKITKAVKTDKLAFGPEQEQYNLLFQGNAGIPTFSPFLS